MNVITQEKDKIKDNSVLLFSGGMDSLMINHILNPNVLLYIKHHNTYMYKELNSIYSLSKKVIDKLIVEENIFKFRHLERDDGIIPGRNIYFITYAVNYGELIYIGSVLGDRSNDKSIYFLETMSKLLSHVYDEQHWCEKRHIKVLAPFKEYTKTELLSLYLENNGSIDDLLKSRSCYSETSEKPCGVCKPCFRKWVAMRCNGINSDNYFETNPKNAKWLQEVLPLIEKGIYRNEKEDAETIRALSK